MSADSNELSSAEFKMPTLNLVDVHKTIITAPDEFKSASMMLLGFYYELATVSNQKVGNDDAAQQNLDKALATYNVAIALNPNEAGVYKSRSELHKELGNYSDALNDLENCRKLDAKKFDDYKTLGDLYKSLNNYPKALENYAVAVEQKSQFDWLDTRVTAYVSRAELYIELGEFDKAIADCDDAIKLAKQSDMNFIIQLLDEVKQQAFDAKRKTGNVAPKVYSSASSAKRTGSV